MTLCHTAACGYGGIYNGLPIIPFSRTLLLIALVALGPVPVQYDVC